MTISIESSLFVCIYQVASVTKYIKGLLDNGTVSPFGGIITIIIIEGVRIVV